ncbi:1-2-dihydroxy-3-keto-5-methylthiopentene dioxygenase 2 [Diplonema papillatum]|nr:1-2-dihydroxy-3-keto-5-methylthiopentene dioxygenase 2 [Diplonema papillatum]
MPTDENASKKRKMAASAPKTLEAWYMCDEVTDQKAENRRSPNQPVDFETLGALGVKYEYFPQPEGVVYPVSAMPWSPKEDEAKDEKIAAYRAEHHMDYADIITITPATLPDYDNKLKAFFEEHIHADDEVRLILEGSGYFDVRSRNKDAPWIRILCTAGQLITLPKGMYHRFTLDSNDMAKAMRLFHTDAGSPIWTPINKGKEADDHPARSHYKQAFLG